jgi:trafficking protein particle complex subunit 9
MLKRRLGSTSGTQCHSQPVSATIPAMTIHTLTLSVVPLEPGQLIIRGCQIQLLGVTPQEFVFNLPPDSTNDRASAPLLRISHSPYDAERIKYTGLEVNHLLRPAPANAPLGTNTTAQPRFLQYQVVAEQPLLRVRRSSITQGTLMLFEGEMYVSTSFVIFEALVTPSPQIGDSVNPREYLERSSRFLQTVV